MSLSGEPPLLYRVTWPFQAGAAHHVGLAVSGGGDSMAMLWLIAPWARALGLPVAVASVDHGLRAEARAEVALVARACAEIGVRHDVLEWRGWDGRGNLQAAARAARAALLSGWARGAGIDTIALAHTLDDQAETVLMRLARGSGVDGLAGMSAERVEDGLRWVRPLLGERRADLRAWLRAGGKVWAEDPSNADTRFDRVRVRQALDLLGPLGIDAPGLVATAERMGMARDALDSVARQAVAQFARIEGGDVVFARAGFDMLPEETRWRLWSEAIRHVGGGAYRPRFAALRGAVAALGDARRATLQGTVLTRSAATWRVGRELQALRGVVAPVGAVWDGRWMVEGPPGEVRALGAAIDSVPGWRAAGLPRATLMVSPAVWRGDTLVAAPLAGFGGDWTARIVAPFAGLTLSH